MDNISHAVVSLVSGEVLHRSLPAEASLEEQNRRQKLLLFTVAAAGNFPDLDLVLYPLLKKPLGYLLHHRGHSHTVLGACFEALLLFAIVWIAWPGARQLLRTSRPTRKGFTWAMVIGFTLHLSMDWLNSYGVHPFYPLYSGWLYGDLVFIVEPLFWIAFGVPLAFLTRRWWLRYPWLAFICGVPLYAFTRGYMPWFSAATLALIALVVGYLQSREPVHGRRALIAVWAIGLIFLAGQAVASVRARSLVAEELHHLEPQSQLIDDALTASPSNPFCWSFVTIEHAGDSYRLRSGTVSVASSQLRPENCPQLFGAYGESTALGEDLLQTFEESASLAALREQDQKNCHLHAWMRFARMPYVTEDRASDARFSHTPRGNFTTLRFEDFKDEQCSPWIPQWEPPRGDLLK